MAFVFVAVLLTVLVSRQSKAQFERSQWISENCTADHINREFNCN